MDHGRFLPARLRPGPEPWSWKRSPFPKTATASAGRFETGNGPTDGRGVFGDSYRLGYRGSLPANFRLVMEQSYRVASDPVYDAVLLTGPHTTPLPASLQAKNRVTYAADYPDLTILLQTNDGRGGWRFLSSDRSNRISIAPPSGPFLFLTVVDEVAAVTQGGGVDDDDGQVGHQKPPSTGRPERCQAVVPPVTE